MIKPIWIIALNTYKEIIRDRILYGLIIFTLLLIGMSLVLGQLSFAEQARISANFGLTSIHISAVILSIFVGSTLVAKEIDKQTILTLLARPISRTQFLLGKSVGLTLIILTIVSALATIHALVLYTLGLSISLSFFISLHGIVLESIVLLSATILFSTFTRPLLVVCFSGGIFLIGHWVENLMFFTSKSEYYAYRIFGYVMGLILPNLEKFNWRDLIVYNDKISMNELSIASIYAIGWFVFFIGISALIIRKKDFA